MLWHKTTTPEPLHRITPDIRWEASDLVNRMTAKDPDQRFATYDDLLKSIEHAFGLPLEHS
jgi:serine/threonine protein kinase